MSETTGASINLNCLFMSINAFHGLPYRIHIIPISNASTVNALMNLIQSLMPDGLTHVNYQLRAFRPGPVVYVNMASGGRISDYFGENLDRNIIHILVEPVSEEN